MTWLNSLATSFMPVQGTDIAKDVDALYIFLLVSSLIAFIILIGGMVLFLIKFKKTSEDQKSAHITHNTFAEFLWSFIPLVILMVIFYWGYVVFIELRVPPEDSEEIHVVAEQWAWTYTYKNGKSISSLSKEPMRVPFGRPTKIVLTAKDVIHSFYVPAFRVKQDAVPGKYTQLWFEPNQKGDFVVFCTEYCGTKHSDMMIKISVMDQEDYSNWYHSEKKAANTPEEKGKELYTTKACAGCHSLDGTRIVGPTFKGLYGANREFESGAGVKADDAYLRESILYSQAKIVKTYPAGAMPVYQGQLEEEEVSNLIAYIKSVK